jgi:hypothetical protein
MSKALTRTLQKLAENRDEGFGIAGLNQSVKTVTDRALESRLKKAALGRDPNRLTTKLVLTAASMTGHQKAGTALTTLMVKAQKQMLSDYTRQVQQMESLKVATAKADEKIAAVRGKTASELAMSNLQKEYQGNIDGQFVGRLTGASARSLNLMR